MIKQEKPDPDGMVTLTFTLPGDIVGPVSVVGDFNHWNPYAHPMTRDEDGTHTVVVRRPQGTTICFRYLTDGGIWLDDADADDYDERGGIVHVGHDGTGRPREAENAQA